MLVQGLLVDLKGVFGPERHTGGVYPVALCWSSEFRWTRKAYSALSGIRARDVSRC